MKVLEIKNLKVEFATDGKSIKAVNGVDLFVGPSELVGVVGESGCGKTVTASSVARLLGESAEITSGEILVGGVDVLSLSKSELSSIRGRKVAYVFQEPATSLNPIFTIGTQIREVIDINSGISSADAGKTALTMLAKVGLPSPEDIMKAYPHQLSGGMKQRAMIAMALLSGASLLIADEPTTALDVTIQAQILAVLLKLKKEEGISILFITHDISLISSISDRLYVMYAGEVVEYGASENVINDPRHPYTQGLIGCVPDFDMHKKRFRIIEGSLPVPTDLPQGCRFHPRCPYAKSFCSEDRPEMIKAGDGHFARCPVVNK